MTRERLMALASALIDLALDLTDDPVRIESYLRPSVSPMRSFGFSALMYSWQARLSGGGLFFCPPARLPVHFLEKFSRKPLTKPR